MARNNSELATISAVAQLLALVLIVAALFFARDVFIPLTLGLLLSFLLSPVVNRVQRWGVPNITAVVTTAAIAFIVLAHWSVTFQNTSTNL
jgi:predicted PurR-regulated permease PerM